MIATILNVGKDLQEDAAKIMKLFLNYENDDDSQNDDNDELYNHINHCNKVCFNITLL